MLNFVASFSKLSKIFYYFMVNWHIQTQYIAFKKKKLTNIFLICLYLLTPYSKAFIIKVNRFTLLSVQDDQHAKTIRFKNLP